VSEQGSADFLTPEPARAPIRPVVWWIVLLGYTASLYGVWLGSARTFTGHEGFVAQVAREMVQTGDWLVPRVAGKPWLEKPPLPYWVVATCGLIFGRIDEDVARLPSVLVGIFAVVLVATLAARWYGPVQGLLTGLIQATTFYTITYARLAEADIYLWALVLTCLWIFAREFVSPHELVAPVVPPGSAVDWAAPLFGIALGLTQLAKGPLFGAVMALLPCVAFVALAGRGECVRFVRWLLDWRAVVLAMVVAGAWPAAITLRHPEALNLWWLHTFGRLGGESTLNPKPFWYYATTLPWQLLPWTLVVLPALMPSLRRAWREANTPDRFLWLWFLLPLLVLTGVSAKHHHYLIYALPPCSFWAADGLLRLPALLQRTLRGVGVAGTAVAVGCCVLAAGWWTVSRLRPEYSAEVALCALVVACGLGGGVWVLRRGEWARAAVTLFAVLWGVYAVVHGSIMAKSDGYREETELYRRVAAAAPPDTPLLIFGLEPSRVLLYCAKPTEVFVSQFDLAERGRQAPHAWVITSIGQERMLRQVGDVEVVDQMPRSRWAKDGDFSRFAVYRVEWRAGQAAGRGQTATAASP
jgi:4-amino-4-deoxy-L-arabinose transferase-like glycosyltransferase